MKLHHALQILWKVCEILLVFPRQNCFKDAGTMSRQQLLFQSANRQDLAAQRDFSSHCQVATHCDLCKRTCKTSGKRYASGWAVLGDGALRHVDVNVHGAIEILW